MTNLTRANGTLKIVNRKIASHALAGVVELTSATANGAPTSNGAANGPAANGVPNGRVQLARKESQSSRHLPVILDEDLKENQIRAAQEKRRQLEEEEEEEEEEASAALVMGGADVASQDEASQQNGDHPSNMKQLKERLALARNKATAERAHQTDSEARPSDADTSAAQFKAPLVWFNIMLFVVLHSCLPVCLYLLYVPLEQLPVRTILWSVALVYLSGLGVTGGAHRLWSHRSYKASLPVELFLMALQTMAGQNSIYTWSRDHRLHHKFSETNADPHNIKRGFFFAHMGWLCCRKHPDVKTKGKLIDMSDLEANPVVMFQHRNFWWLAVLFTVLVPTYVPVLLWRERLLTAFSFAFMLRYLITLHGTWLVNSAAHYYGSRPYDAHMEARESPLVIATGLGEGFHNYHHTFPFDYSTSEFGKYFNITTAFIDACAALKLVHDRRKMDRAMIESRMARTGERSKAN